jgi:hypothetical protein
MPNSQPTMPSTIMVPKPRPPPPPIGSAEAAAAAAKAAAITTAVLDVRGFADIVETHAILPQAVPLTRIRCFYQVIAAVLNAKVDLPKIGRRLGMQRAGQAWRSGAGAQRKGFFLEARAGRARPASSAPAARNR